jgi:MoaA/NifB/PqqE/SkfB family radical SAM enzyme
MFIWVPTWRCNRRCSYCDYDYRVIKEEPKCIAFDRAIPAREVAPERWIAFFRAHPEAQHIELTGGEPTVYEGLGEVLKALPDGMTWAITTNALTKAVVDLPYKRCTCVTASYHYDKDDVFFGNIRKIRRRVKCLRVTIVITPDNIDGAAETIARIRGEGVQVNLHPLLTPGWRWDDASWARIRALDAKPDVYLVDEITQGWEEGPEYGTCHLGSAEYATLGPTGDVYSCYGMLVHNHPMGHIDSTWDQSKRVRPCFIRCEFPCDVQSRRRVPCV